MHLCVWVKKTSGKRIMNKISKESAKVARSEKVSIKSTWLKEWETSSQEWVRYFLPLSSMLYFDMGRFRNCDCQNQRGGIREWSVEGEKKNYTPLLLPTFCFQWFPRWYVREKTQFDSGLECWFPFGIGYFY